jgi:hypothetical protein
MAYHKEGVPDKSQKENFYTEYDIISSALHGAYFRFQLFISQVRQTAKDSCH